MRKRAPEWRAPLDRRIGIHDRHQFELKLEYQPPPRTDRSTYVVETFMFIPGSLNVTPETCPTNELYQDIHNYVRLKTPELSFSELQALPDSPLVRAAEEGEKLRRGGDAARFIYECKLYASVYRAHLRDLVDRLGDLGGPHWARQAEALVETVTRDS